MLTLRPALISLTAFGIALMLTVWLWAPVFNVIPFSAFFAAIAISAWFGGITTGLPCTFASGVATATLMYRETGSVAVLPLAVLLGVAMLIVWLADFRLRILGAASNAQQELSAVLDSITDGFLALDRNWRFTYINSTGERMLDQSRSELLKRDFWEVYPATLNTIVEREFRRAVAQNITLDFENYYEPWSRWFSLRVYPAKDGLSVYFRDITSQKRVDQALKEQTERLRVTLNSIGDAVVVTDTTGAVVSLNPIAEALCGCTTAEASGQHISKVLDLRSEESKNRVENPIEDVLRDGVVRGLANHTVLISKQGREVPIDDSAAPIKDAEGRVLGAVLVFRDVSARRAAEREKQQLLEREREARKQAENANRSKDEFLAVVSHELRTPLTPIIGWTQIMRYSPGNQENIQHGLTVIDRNVRAQVRLIEDLLDVSRVVAGKIRLELKAVGLAQVVEAAMDAVRSASQAKNITLSFTMENSVGPVLGDAERLQQVVWNLLANAIKFSPPDACVQVHLRREGTTARLEVIDQGEGIDATYLPFVFDRFSQYDTTSTRRHGGLGIGLSVVKQVVELHGGTVSAYSAGAAKGSTFTVELPLARGADANVVERSSGTWSRTRPAPSNLAGINILVVDDEADAREFIEFALSRQGAKVKTAPSAKDALRMLTSEHFDLLLSDIGMPIEDGYVLMQRLHEQGILIPAIAVTAFARQEDRTRAIESGFRHHMSKPVDPIELGALVSSVVLSGRN